jgi:hypothetical protein
LSQVLTRPERVTWVRWVTERLGAVHWLPVVFFVLIALPLVVQTLGPPPRRWMENRTLNVAPRLPRSFGELTRFPSAVDNWLNDQFGLRRSLIELNNWLRYRLFGEVASHRLVLGRNGRLFMGSHDGWPDNAMILFLCGAPMPPAVIEREASAAEAVLTKARSIFPDTRLLLVPTAGRLYPEDIPQRLAASCQGAEPAGDRIVARLKAGPEGAAVIYPLEPMLALKAQMPIIPRAGFHWASEGALRVAELVSEQELGMTRRLSLPLTPDNRSSDLDGLLPGLGLHDRILKPDLRRAGIAVCWAERCGALPGLPLAVSEAIGRYRRPGAPAGRLVIIADSYGEEIAPDFVEYFGEVLHIRTNLTPKLSAQDRAALIHYALKDYHPDRVLLLYHDGALFNGLEAPTFLFSSVP